MGDSGSALVAGGVQTPHRQRCCRVHLGHQPRHTAAIHNGGVPGAIHQQLLHQGAAHGRHRYAISRHRHGGPPGGGSHHRVGEPKSQPAAVVGGIVDGRPPSAAVVGHDRLHKVVGPSKRGVDADLGHPRGAHDIDEFVITTCSGVRSHRLHTPVGPIHHTYPGVDRLGGEVDAHGAHGRILARHHPLTQGPSHRAHHTGPICHRGPHQAGGWTAASGTTGALAAAWSMAASYSLRMEPP